MEAVFGTRLGSYPLSMTGVTREVSGWILDGELGRGGNATVWRASRGPITAALKVLRARAVSGEPYRRFRREAEFHRSVSDRPGVLPLIDADVPEAPTRAQRAWLATPIATPIRRALGAEPNLGEVVAAVAEVALTLADFAEETGAHHRDLKPENLFRYQTAWVVGDFGLVTFPGAETLTQRNRGVGPVWYLAPELLEDPLRRDAGPADVYSLAKTLWVLVLAAPYPQPGQIGTGRTSLNERLSDPRAGLLDPLLRAATEFDPPARPTMRELATELNRWRRPATARTATPFPEIDEVISLIAATTAPALDAADRQAELTREASRVLVRVRQATGELNRLLDGAIPRHGRFTNSAYLLDRFPRLGSPLPAIHRTGWMIEREAPPPSPPKLFVLFEVQAIINGQIHLAGGIVVEPQSRTPELVWEFQSSFLPGTAAEEDAVAGFISGALTNIHHGLEAYLRALEPWRENYDRNSG